MFRAAHRSSSGALNCICNLWFIYPCGDRPLSRLSGTTAAHHMGIQTRGCKYSLELLMMSGVPLETCWAFNKFYYKLHLVCLSTPSYYDARIHEYQKCSICGICCWQIGTGTEFFSGYFSS